jgi:hypothetical protein
MNPCSAMFKEQCSRTKEVVANIATKWATVTFHCLLWQQKGKVMKILHSSYIIMSLSKSRACGRRPIGQFAAWFGCLITTILYNTHNFSLQAF